MEDRELIGKICDTADNTAGSASAIYYNAAKYRPIKGYVSICLRHAEETVRRLKELDAKLPPEEQP